MVAREVSCQSSAFGFSLAGGPELLPPVLAPAGLRRFVCALLRKLPRDERLLVAAQVAKTSVAQGVRRVGAGQVQPPPHLHHPRRGPKPGPTGIRPAQPLPCLPAGLAQLVGGKGTSSGVAGELSGERVLFLEHYRLPAFSLSSGADSRFLGFTLFEHPNTSRKRCPGESGDELAVRGQ